MCDIAVWSLSLVIAIAMTSFERYLPIFVGRSDYSFSWSSYLDKRRHRDHVAAIKSANALLSLFLVMVLVHVDDKVFSSEVDH